MRICLLISLLSIVYTTKSIGQEVLPKANKLEVSASGSLNKTATDLINVYNTHIRYSYTLDKTEFNAQTKWIYGSKLAGISNNDVTITLDGNRFHDQKKHLNSWILGSFTSSYSLNIYSQLQAGVGLAYKFELLKQDRIKKDEKETPYQNLITLRVSNGIIYEHSNILNKESVQEMYYILRNSLRLQLVANMWHNVSLRGTYFWQPALNDIKDVNMIADVSLGIKLSNNIKFDTKFAYNYITRTAKENLIFTYGISTTFMF